MRRIPRITGCVLLTLGLAGPTVLHAQDGAAADLDAGTYEGSISFTGGFIIDMAQAIVETGQDTGGADITGQLAIDASINGPASMTVSDGGVTGDWTMAGTSTTDGRITGSFSGITTVIEITGSGIYDGAGTFGGSPNAASMVGTLNSTSTATVNAGGMEQSATTSDSQELSLTMTEPVGDCGRAFARVDLEIRQQIDQIPGATATVIGVFTADTFDGGYDFTLLETINADISSLWNRLDDADEAFGLLAEAFELLRSIESAEDQYSGLTCGEDPDFANAMTLLGAEVVRVALDLATDASFDPATRVVIIDQALEMGLRTGALGAGRGDQGGARQIAQTAEALLGQAFNEASNSGDLATVEAAAVLARQYGWELVNDAGVTSTDALLVFGSE